MKLFYSFLKVYSTSASNILKGSFLPSLSLNSVSLTVCLSVNVSRVHKVSKPFNLPRNLNSLILSLQQPLSSDRKTGDGRNESVIVIDSDSDGEREHASSHCHGNPDSVQSSLSPKSGSSNSRPASAGRF